MADIALIKRNIGRMIEQNAPESDIDAYVAGEGVTPEELRSGVAAKPAPGFADTALDVGKQALSGLVTGTEAIPSTVPSILSLAGRGLSALGFGNKEAEQEQANLKALIDKNRNGGIAQYLPKPETEAGQAARNIAEFVPSGIGVRAGLRPALAAGAGSEALGQLTEGTEAEPYARLGGALAGGLVGARSADKAAARSAVRNLPETRKQVDDLASQLYKVNEEATTAIPISKTEARAFAQDVKNKLNAEGAREINSREAHAALDALPDKVNDAYDLVKAREVIRKDLHAAGEGRAAQIIEGELDRAIDAVSPKGVGVLQAADREYSIARTLDALDKRFKHVERGTSAANSGKNLGNKYRQNLTSLLNNQRASRGLKPAEIAQAERTIEGSTLENLLRNYSNRFGGGGGVGQTILGVGLGGGAYGLGLDPQSAALLGGGIGLSGQVARGIANRMTARQANKLREMVAARSALSGGFPARTGLDEQGLLALLSAAPAGRGILSQLALEPSQ